MRISNFFVLRILLLTGALENQIQVSPLFRRETKNLVYQFYIYIGKPENRETITKKDFLSFFTVEQTLGKPKQVFRKAGVARSENTSNFKRFCTALMFILMV